MNPHIITEDKLKELLQYAYDYGRSCQFNYGLFGPTCEEDDGYSIIKCREQDIEDNNILDMVHFGFSI